MALNRFQPPSFQEFATELSSQPHEAGQHLDRAIQLAYQQIYALATDSPVDGSTTVTGSSLAIMTGLSAVTNVVACIDSSTATNVIVTASLSSKAGCIDLRCWKPTAAGDTTPIAATSAVTVRWFARGTP